MPHKKVERPFCKTCKRKRVKRAKSEYCSLACSNRARAKPKKKKLFKRTEQKLHRLSVRHQKVVMGIAEGKGHQQAGLDAGIPPKCVAAQVSQIMKMPKVRETLREILMDAGFTDQFYAQKVFEGSEAMKTVSVVSGKDANSETMDFVDVPDWANRRHYLAMGAKGLGHDAVAEAPIPSLRVTFNLVQPTSETQQAEKEVYGSEVPPARVKINVMED